MLRVIFVNDTIKLVFPWLHLALNLSVIMLIVIILSVIILSVVTLSVAAPSENAATNKCSGRHSPTFLRTSYEKSQDSN